MQSSDYNKELWNIFGVKGIKDIKGQIQGKMVESMGYMFCWCRGIVGAGVLKV